MGVARNRPCPLKIDNTPLGVVSGNTQAQKYKRLLINTFIHIHMFTFYDCEDCFL